MPNPSVLQLLDVGAYNDLRDDYLRGDTWGISVLLPQFFSVS